ncbi:hypothetical protein M0R45_002840 [Rubus argutus]|uniref:Protein kinase domain-containing protein n=1 Tax=Rubus argutus TaxID=59490 RepID=A0AAW1VM18_RUBAR
MGILSFTFIGVYLSLNFLKISTLADSISKNELGLSLFSRPKGVHRSLLAPTWGDICDTAGTAAPIQFVTLDLYIRVPASELKANRWPKAKIAVIVVSVVFGMLLVAYCIHRNRTKFKEKARKNGIISQNNGKNEDIELPIFSLSTIVTATDNFSWNMKLGEGGFGPVYKGNLVDGREIAVKRLSRSSGQGTIEFKNEVLLIAKLQQPEIFLDSYLFDQTRGRLLDWPRRFQLSVGSPGVFFIYIKIPD